MDRAVIDEKLESLRRCVRRVEEKCPATADAFVDNPDAQDIVALNLTRAVQLCVDLAAQLISNSELPAPNTMGEAFQHLVRLKVIDDSLALRMRKAVGFRNIAVHNYEAIDWAIVHAICTTRLGDFVDFARAVDKATTR